MAKKTDDKSIEETEADQSGGDGAGSFFQRWSNRKSSARSTEEEEAAEALAEDGAEEDGAEEDGEDALSDEELCEKYELQHPDQCEDPDQLDEFFKRPVPDRLKQIAMRRMWRLNPLFRFADEMVEYGENYTDAATVIPNMQTAYQVGKGYLKKILDEEETAADEVEAAENEADTAASGDAKADKAADADNAEKTTAGDDSADNANPDDQIVGEENSTETMSSGDGEAGTTNQTDQADAGEEAVSHKPAPRPRQVSFRRT